MGVGCTSPLSPSATELPTPSVTEQATILDDSTIVVPPTELYDGYGDKGPFMMRLMTATSEDGVNWSKTGTILSKQANTPNVVVDANGVIYVYYTGGHIADQEQAMAVAVSTDQGETWEFRLLDIIGDKLGPMSGDPDVVLTDDGVFHLYFTSELIGDGYPAIFSAESQDGISFEYVGKAFAGNGNGTMDSSTYYLDGVWYMSTFQLTAPGHYFAESRDGETFTYVGEGTVKPEGTIPFFLANEVLLENGQARMFGFYAKEGFRSATSTDGMNWTDEGYDLIDFIAGSEEDGLYLKDPAVAQLQDGSYLMVYVSRGI